MALELKRTHQRTNIGNLYEQKNQILALEGRQLTYSNQQEAALKIIGHYMSGKLAVVLVAQPGAGKTGVVVELQRLLCTHPDDNMLVLAEDFHTISGMSDKEWKAQMQKNVISDQYLRENVRHRGELEKIKDTLRNLKNGIVASDECHIAAGERMIIAKRLNESGLLNITLLLRDNNRLLEISATPEGVMIDLEKWGDKAALVLLVPGDNYKGFQSMLDEQRIRNAPLITSEMVAIRLVRFFDARYATTTKKYILIRTEDANTIGFLKAAASSLDWSVLHHDSENKIEDADTMMGQVPAKHTIIFIKGFWRASKRLIRNNVGGTYEQPPKKRNTTATSQGLTARFCDTFVYSGDWLNPDLRPIHFCDMGAIEQYMNWIQGGCDYRNSEYTANKMKSKDGRVRAPKTKVHHTNVVDLVPVLDDRDAPVNNYLLSPTFDTREAARNWILPRINWAADWNTTNSRVVTVNTCDQAGDPGNTHLRSRGESIPIPTEDAFRLARDWWSRFGAGVRCVPVKTGDATRYIVPYKESWLL